MYLRLQGTVGEGAAQPPRPPCSKSLPRFVSGRALTSQAITCDDLRIHLWRLENDLAALKVELGKSIPDRAQHRALKQCVLERVGKLIELVRDDMFKDCCFADLKELKAKVKKLPWVFVWEERSGQVVRVQVFTDIRAAFRNLIQAIKTAQNPSPSAPCCNCWAAV